MPNTRREIRRPSFCNMYIVSKVSLYYLALALNGSNQSSITTMALWDMKSKYPTRCRNHQNRWIHERRELQHIYQVGERRIDSQNMAAKNAIVHGRLDWSKQGNTTKQSWNILLKFSHISQSRNTYQILGIFSTSNKHLNTWIYWIEFWKRFPSRKHIKSNSDVSFNPAYRKNRILTLYKFNVSFLL